MTDEPELKEVDERELEPATKADVHKAQYELAGMFARSVERLATRDDLAAVAGRIDRLDGRMDGFDGRMDGLDERMGGFDERLGRLERGQSDILKVMQAIDEQLKEHRTHPARIARLERSVFRG